MDSIAVRPTSAALRLALLGASVAVAWTAVCLIVGSVSASTAAVDPLGIDTVPSASVSEVVSSVTAPVAATSPAVAVAVAPTVPVAPVLAPIVTPVADVVTPVVAAVAPVTQPVATLLAPAVAAVAPVVEPIVTPVLAPVIEPLTAITSAVPPLATVIEPVLLDDTLPVIAAPANEVNDPAPTSTVTAPQTALDPTVDQRGIEVGPAAASVVSGATVSGAPADQPSGSPTPAPVDPVVLPTPSAGANSHGVSGGPTAVSDAPTGPRAAALASVILSTHGAATLPSAPVFDLGSTPD